MLCGSVTGGMPGSTSTAADDAAGGADGVAKVVADRLTDIGSIDIVAWSIDSCDADADADAEVSGADGPEPEVSDVDDAAVEPAEQAVTAIIRTITPTRRVRRICAPSPHAGAAPTGDESSQQACGHGCSAPPRRSHCTGGRGADEAI